MNQTYYLRLKAQNEFVCENCGECCKNCTPIELFTEDLYRLAHAMNKKPIVAYKRYVKPYPGSKNNLRACIKKDSPCRFYKEGKGCIIYEDRPIVCRSFPFLSGENPESDTFTVPKYCKGAIKVYEKMRERGEIK